jgi:hypothetical protein
MSKVFVNIGLSLDGFMAPEGMTLENWDTPEYKNWGAKWGALMGWIHNSQFFRENLQLGVGGETGLVNDAPGQKRLHSILRFTFLLTRIAIHGFDLVGQLFTSSMAGDASSKI